MLDRASACADSGELLSGSRQSLSRGSFISHGHEATAQEIQYSCSLRENFRLGWISPCGQPGFAIVAAASSGTVERWSEAIGEKEALAANAHHRHFSESSIVPSQFFRSWPRKAAIFRK
jgi:hypothetical protein